MTNALEGAIFSHALFEVLDETLENAHGIYLDRGTSLFETLQTINAGQASLPVGGRCAPLAAQVEHLRFFLEVLEQYILHGSSQDVDWGEIWRSVEAVTPEQWQEARSRLELAGRRVRGLLGEWEAWNEEAVGGALAIVAHTAYHLGEIRQALCTLQDSRP
jgi:hypothetical protein